MTSVRALVTTSVAGLLAACALVAAPPLAEARSLTDAEAENAARMAVAPEPVVDVLCFRASTRRGKPEKRRALCLVGRPGPEGLVCDSVVEVTVPRARYGAISTDVVRLNVCMPPHDRSKKLQQADPPGQCGADVADSAEGRERHDDNDPGSRLAGPGPSARFNWRLRPVVALVVAGLPTRRAADRMPPTLSQARDHHQRRHRPRCPEGHRRPNPPLPRR